MKITRAGLGRLIVEDRTVVVDLEVGFRGGSIYMDRLVSWLEACEASVALVRISLSSLRGFYDLVLVFLGNWSGRFVLRGTLPGFLPIALLSRSSLLYLGTPVNRWSWKSRVLFWLASLRPGFGLVAASVYTGEVALKNSLFRKAYVSYAKVSFPVEPVTSWVRSYGSVAFAILSPGDQSKGFEASLTFLASVSQCLDVFIDIYGKSQGEFDVSRYSSCGEVSVHGFVENPFEHFSMRHKGVPSFYVGLSLYEGLHMAVVDAACHGVPSLLSDIPAHRELESIAGLPLLIAGDLGVLVESFIELYQSEAGFDMAREAALRLAVEFKKRALDSEAVTCVSRCH